MRVKERESPRITIPDHRNYKLVVDWRVRKVQGKRNPRHSKNCRDCQYIAGKTSYIVRHFGDTIEYFVGKRHDSYSSNNWKVEIEFPFGSDGLAKARKACKKVDKIGLPVRCLIILEQWRKEKHSRRQV